MKSTKKFLVMLLTVIMILGMTYSVFAAEEIVNGSITIKNPAEGQTYTIYRIFDLDSYDADNEGYSYKVNENWTGFIESQGIKDVYVSVDSNGYVRWLKWLDSDGNSISAQATEEFAKLALDWAKTNKISPSATYDPNTYNPVENTNISVSDISGKITFSNLALGYYLLDSSQGALCSLDTAAKDVEIEDKNEAPVLTKQVLKKDGTYGVENTAQLNSIIEFKITVDAKKGAENYVLHDKMDEGFSFIAISTVKKVTVIDGNEIEKDLTAGIDYNKYLHNSTESSTTDGCAFELEFTENFCKTLTSNDKIVVTYTARLNNKAVIGDDGNKNTTWLIYGEENKTTEAVTRTRTWKFQLIKTDIGENNLFELLDGAEFKLYTDETSATPIKFVELKDELNKVIGYRVATSDDLESEQTEVIVAGIPIIQGLDTAIYYLEETVAPDGYYKLGERLKVEISSNMVAGTQEIADGKYNPTLNDGKGGGVQVQNSKSSLLPSTGGIGTVIFYVVGGILVLAAVILFIVRRYMNSNGKSSE